MSAPNIGLVCLLCLSNSPPPILSSFYSKEDFRIKVPNIVQESVIKTIPKKKKCKKAKWLSEEALQIAEKKRSERQRRKGKIYTCECRVPKNSKER